MSKVRIKNLQFLQKYNEKFSDFSFVQLIESYESVESELVETIGKNVDTFLGNCGYNQGKDSTFKRGSSVFQKHVLLDNNRNLTITFLDFEDPNPSKVESKEISEFGLIKKIDFLYNDFPGIDFFGLFEILLAEIRWCYIALEQHFVAESSEFSESAYRQLNSALLSALKYSEKTHLIDKYFFLISDDKYGYCYFDRQSLVPVIEDFKNDQHPRHSPFEIVTWLISAPFPFQESISLQAKQSGSAITTFINSIPYYHRFPKILRGIMRGLSTQQITVKDIHQVRNYSLTITFPAQYQNEILEVLEQSEETLKKSFESGIKKYSALFKGLRIRSNTIDRVGVSDFLASFVAKISLEMMKQQ